MSSTSFERSLGGIDADVAAAGDDQSSAVVLTAGKNVITSATENTADGVRLPEGYGVGEILYVANNTGESIDVFPPVGGAIGGGSADAAVALAANSMAIYMSLGEGNWSVTS